MDMWIYKDSYVPDYKERLTWWNAPYGGLHILKKYNEYFSTPDDAASQMSLFADTLNLYPVLEV